MRVIDINGKKYEWKIGKYNAVIKNDGISYHVSLTELTGWDNSTIERGQEKRYFSVTPKMIRKYILTKIERVSRST